MMPHYGTAWHYGPGLLAYTSNRGGPFDIWLYHPMFGYHIPLTRGIGEQYSVPYWSPDNLKIALIGKGSIVYILDLIRSTAAQIDQIEPYTLLDWSPDSRRLTYVKNGKIVLYDTVEHAARTIDHPGAADAQWFPSGMELLYTAPDAAGNNQLFSVNADGANRRQLTRMSAGPMHNVRLSPDGRFALFTSPGVSISIVTTVDLATGNTYTLEGGTQAKNYYPEWSPDSSRIAYSATELSPENRYYSLIQTDSRTGGRIVTWAVSDCYASPVSWAANGTGLAYLTGCETDSPADQLWFVDFRRPTQPVKLAEGGRITAVRWSQRSNIANPVSPASPVSPVSPVSPASPASPVSPVSPIVTISPIPPVSSVVVPTVVVPPVNRRSS